jgi:hypothetical protein
MIWILPFIFLGLSIYLFWFEHQHYGREWAFGIGLISAIICTTLFVVLLGFTFANGEGLAKWQAFYTTNESNYRVVIKETEALLSREQFENQLIAGSVEKWQQSEYVSLAIKNWVDSVNQYNSTIVSMQYFNRSIWIGVLVPDEVEEMKLIKIQ